jgi:hypothetical protein
MDLTFHPRFDCATCPTSGVLPTHPLFPIRCGILPTHPLFFIRCGILPLIPLYTIHTFMV